MVSSWLTQVQLAHPAWLWLLPPLVAGWLALGLRAGPAPGDARELPGHGASRRGRYRHPRFALLAAAAAQAGRQRANLVRSGWRVAVLACLLLALAQPERLGSPLPQAAQQRDIVFVVDNSVAMNLRDYVFEQQRVARLSVLKAVLDQFVTQLRGDRISVVLYADRAYTLVPLTFDHALVRAMLARVETGLAGRSNAVGDAVALAVKEAGAGSGRRRILVLLSSAARPTGGIEPLDAARLAAQRGLRLYTVAIGAGSNAADEARSAGLIYDPADLARLHSMARITGADSFVATDTGQLRAAIESVGRRETEPTTRSERRYVRRPLYQWPLLAGLLLLSVAQVGALLGRRA